MLPFVKASNRGPDRVVDGDDLELAAREAAMSAAAAVAASSAAVRSIAASQTWNPGEITATGYG